MIKKSALAILATTALVSVTSAALAQSADRYGSTLPYHYDSGGGQVRGSWSPEQQGSTNAGQAQASGRQGQAGTQRAERTRGYSAFGQAPARRSSSAPAGR
jgi:hypothetical protein